MERNINKYVSALLHVFEKASKPDVAKGQKAYMKHNFEFYGIQSPERKLLQRPFFLKAQLLQKEHLASIVKTLWQAPERELQYCGQELVMKYKNQFEKADISLFEYMITHKSWWDTVDFIASNLVGHYFKTYPGQRRPICEKWLKSDNLWLQRATLLFQLKYKTELDTELLEHNINYLLGSQEFFINKAIGWILREYSKANRDWVQDFVNKTELNALSFREATKYISL